MTNSQTSNPIKTLHNDALKSLIAIQYYMSTLSTNDNEKVRTQQYAQCLELMSNAVNLLIKTTTAQNTGEEYPQELLVVMKNLHNIDQKLNFLTEKITKNHKNHDCCNVLIEKP